MANILREQQNNHNAINAPPSEYMTLFAHEISAKKTGTYLDFNHEDCRKKWNDTSEAMRNWSMWKSVRGEDVDPFRNTPVEGINMHFFEVILAHMRAAGFILGKEIDDEDDKVEGNLVTFSLNKKMLPFECSDQDRFFGLVMDEENLYSDPAGLFADDENNKYARICGQED